MCVWRGRRGVVGVTVEHSPPDRLRTAPKLVTPPVKGPPKQLQQLQVKNQPKRKQRLPWPGISHMDSLGLL